MVAIRCLDLYDPGENEAPVRLDDVFERRDLLVGFAVELLLRGGDGLLLGETRRGRRDLLRNKRVTAKVGRKGDDILCFVESNTSNSIRNRDSVDDLLNPYMSSRLGRGG